MTTISAKMDESERLKILDYYKIMDTEEEEELNEIVEFASLLMGTEISLISLLDNDRQWFKAKIGMDTAETPKQVSFCQYAIEGTHPFIVEDASKDERFVSNPLVVSSPNIRFYAGIPLITKEGAALGTLCVIDSVPKKITDKELIVLEKLRDRVVRFFEKRVERIIEAKRVHTTNDEKEELAYNLNTVTDLLNIGMWRFGKKRVFVSKQGLINFDFSNEKSTFLRSDFLDFFDDLDKGKLASNMRKDIKAMQDAGEMPDFAVKTKGGRILRIIMKPTEDGEFCNALCIDMSLHAKKMAEAENFSAMMSNLMSAVIVADKNGVIEYANKVCEEFLSISISDIIGENGWDILFISSQKNNVALTRKIEKYYSESIPFSEKLRIPNPEGQIMRVMLKVSPIFDSDGNIERTIIIFDNIEEMEQKNETLEILSLALEKSESGVLLANHDGVVQWTNQSFLKITGTTSEEIIGSKPRDVFEHAIQHNEEEFKLLVKNYYKNPQRFNVNYTLKRKDGLVKSLILNNIPIFNENQEFTNQVEIISDVTQISEINDELTTKILESELVNKILELSMEATVYSSNYIRDLERVLNDYIEERCDIDFEGVVIESDMDRIDDADEKLIYWINLDQSIRHIISVSCQNSLNLILNTTLSLIHDDFILMREVVNAEKNERKRVSRELHDGLCQELTAISLRLKMEKLKRNDETLEFDELIQKVDEAIDNTRRLSKNLIPIQIEDYGIITALRNLIEEVTRLSGIEINFNSNTSVQSLGSLDQFIYRIIQELVNNIVRHSNATKASLSIVLLSNWIQITIIDNGVGFDLKTVEGGTGLNSIMQRLKVLKGGIETDRKDDQTIIDITLKL